MAEVPLRLVTIGFSHFCEKARWARMHLMPGERGPVDTACKAAGLALE